MMRVLTFALVAALVLTAGSLDTRAQTEAPPIKIGYAISRTGPFAPAAVVESPDTLYMNHQSTDLPSSSMAQSAIVFPL